MKIVLLFTLALFMILAFGFTPVQAKEWTVMVYMAADNGPNEDLEGDAWVDLYEMLQAKVDTDKVNIVVEGDFGSKGNDGRYLLQGDTPKMIKKYDEINLGDPKNLEKFIKETKNDYPADRYMMVFWGHGTGMISVAGPGTIAAKKNSRSRTAHDYIYESTVGLNKIFAKKAVEALIGYRRPSRSFAYDESSKDSITLVEAKQALDNAGVKFSVISFDACIMNQAEVLYQLRDYTDYITAAFTYFPGGGYWYTGWLKALSDNSSMSNEDLAKAILASNKKYYTDEKLYIEDFTLTVKYRIIKSLNNNKEEVLKEMEKQGIPADKFDEFCQQYAKQYVKENLSDIQAAAKKAFKAQPLNFGMLNISKMDDFRIALDNMINITNKDIALEARQHATAYNPLFGEKYGDWYIDTHSFAKYIEENGNCQQKLAAKAVINAIEAVEVKRIDINLDGTDLANAYFGILFPENVKLYNVISKFYTPLEFAKDSSWDEFLAELAKK